MGFAVRQAVISWHNPAETALKGTEKALWWFGKHLIYNGDFVLLGGRIQPLYFAASRYDVLPQSSSSLPCPCWLGSLRGWTIRNRVAMDLHNDGKPDWWGGG